MKVLAEEIECEAKELAQIQKKLKANIQIKYLYRVMKKLLNIYGMIKYQV